VLESVGHNGQPAGLPRDVIRVEGGVEGVLELADRMVDYHRVVSHLREN